MTVLDEYVPRPSALICWPVEFLDNKVRNIPQPHVTALYFPDVTNAEFKKEHVVDVFKNIAYTKKYELGNVNGVSAFGEEKNVPVLRIGSSNYAGLSERIMKFRCLLDAENMFADRTYTINPHLTVDLETLINPPTQVLLRPLELWWMDDEPVVL